MTNWEQDKDTLAVGIVGHVSIDDLEDFKTLIEHTPYIKIIFFKTSSEKLWIQEGDYEY